MLNIEEVRKFKFVDSYNLVAEATDLAENCVAMMTMRSVQYHGRHRSHILASQVLNKLRSGNPKFTDVLFMEQPLICCSQQHSKQSGTCILVHKSSFHSTFHFAWEYRAFEAVCAALRMFLLCFIVLPLQIQRPAPVAKPKHRIFRLKFKSTSHIEILINMNLGSLSTLKLHCLSGPRTLRPGLNDIDLESPVFRIACKTLTA